VKKESRLWFAQDEEVELTEKEILCQTVIGYYEWAGSR